MVKGNLAGTCQRVLRRLTLLVLLIGTHTLHGAPAKPLVFAVSDAAAMPWSESYVTEGEYRVRDGILPMLAKRIESRLHSKLVVKVLPRQHIEAALLNGNADMVCHMQPEWLKAPASHFLWSDPLIEGIEHLISRQPANPISRLEQLHGKTIGVVKNYRYPLLDPLFEQGLATKSAASSDKNNFLQLFDNGDVDVVVFNNLSFNYLMKKFAPAQANIVVHPLVTQLTSPRCAISTHSGIQLAAVNDAIREIRDQQLIERFISDR